MPAAVPHLSSASLSAQGYVRPNNEDRVHCDDTRGIYLVVDGMGGHAAGEQAAAIAIERIVGRLERATDTPQQRLREAITLANNAIHEAAQTNPSWGGMACVLTAALVEGSSVTVGHVGDSRLYQIRQGSIRKLTRDHSPVGEREDAGEIPENEAMQHPRRNEVYRDVGSEEHRPDDPDFIDIFEFAFEPDSAVLLCSDGLSDAISSEAILRLVEENAKDPSTAVKLLVAAATRVGQDNVSAILLEGDRFAQSCEGKRAREPVERETDGERTGRLNTHTSPSVFAGRVACLLYGTTLGALIAFFGIRYLPSILGEHSNTITVSPTLTVQGALARAKNGDTVVLPPGTYSEVIHLKDGVNVVAQKRRTAVMQGLIVAENGVHARVEGLQVHGADIGVLVRDSEIKLADDEISGAQDIGVEYLGSSRGSVVGCHIHGNAGAGIAILDTASPEIRNNVISGNGAAATKLGPGLLIRTTATLTVNGNIFSGNGGEAVWSPREDAQLLQDNAFALGIGSAKPPAIRIVAPEGTRP